MTARDKLQVVVEEGNYGPRVWDFVEGLVGVVMEDLGKNPLAPQEPDLIQGYTAEQWQEIIDGGYLCEFGVADVQTRLGVLTEAPKDNMSVFTDENGHFWCNCRPAQIKGVMRPIFVEPVDKENAMCAFFNINMKPIAPQVYRWPWPGSATPTSYIEV